MKGIGMVVAGLAATIALGVAIGAAPLPKGAPDLDAKAAPDPRVMLDGDEMKAFLAAYPKFKAVEASYSKKQDLKYYRIGFSSDKRASYVYFDAKDVPGGKVVSPHGNEYGVHLIIAVEHGTNKVLAAYEYM